MSPKATAKQQREARAIVRKRDGHRCQMCGQSIINIPSSIHHRINRGMGGNGNLERPSLLVRLCGTGTWTSPQLGKLCHGWLTEHPKQAQDTGWLIPKLNPDIDPTKVPLLAYDGWVLLDDDGGRVACDPPGGAVVWIDRTMSCGTFCVCGAPYEAHTEPCTCGPDIEGEDIDMCPGCANIDRALPGDETVPF